MKRGKKEDGNTKHELMKRKLHSLSNRQKIKTKSWSNGRAEWFVKQAYCHFQVRKNRTSTFFVKDKTQKSIRVQLHFTAGKLEKQLCTTIWSYKSGATELNYALSLWRNISCSDNLLENSRENHHQLVATKPTHSTAVHI